MAGTFQIAEAQLDYEGEGPDDLAVHRGDVLLVSQRDEIGWWVGVCRGEVGLVPENFVRLSGAAAGLDALVQQEVEAARSGAIADEHLRQVLLLGADPIHDRDRDQDKDKDKDKDKDIAMLLETHRTRLGERLGQLVEESHQGWIRRAEQEQSGTLLSGQIADAQRERDTLSHATQQQRTTHTRLQERLRFIQHNSATHAATHDALRDRCADLRTRIRAHADAHTDAHANALRDRAAAADRLRQQSLLHTRLRQLHSDLVLEQRRMRPGQQAQSHSHSLYAVGVERSLSSPRVFMPDWAPRVYPRIREQDASAGVSDREGDDDEDDAVDAVPYISQREIQRQESLLQLHSRGVTTPRSLPASQRSTPAASPMVASSPAREYLSAVATPRSISRTQSEVSQIEGELYRSRFPHRVPKSPSQHTHARRQRQIKQTK